jgi:DNA polymerase-3 subunit epsilon
MRQIVLDTETTGLEVIQGHRVIEIGCVELVNRRPTNNDFHRYIHPDDKDIDPGAEQVHGISMAFLADKPKFKELGRELWDYLVGSELVIHNAAFDIGFLDKEFERLGITQKLSEVCTVVDTVALARRLHPGQKVNLDALCRRYMVDASHRDFHGALLDARLLADVYLAMTGGQSALGLDDSSAQAGAQRRSRFVELLGAVEAPLRVIRVGESEQAAHLDRLKTIDKKSGGKLIWADELSQAIH